MAMPEQQSAGNAAQVQFWNSPGARAWADQHERMDRALAPLLEALIAVAAPQPGERVLDIGCASGTTVLELASRVGAGGYVLGVDIAERSVARAQQRIAAAGFRHAEVIVADAATHAFPNASFDLLCSRLGIMFFSDPIAAFTNIRRAMKPAGCVAIACFRAPAESPFPSTLASTVQHLLPPIPALGPEEPGPFSWADPSRVHRILEGAGFSEVSLTPVNPIICLAPPGGAAEAADFAMVFGPLTRVLTERSAAEREVVRATLQAFFATHDGPAGVTLPAANWLVQARA
jgi:ubiquinone/menaquinone biosynthesis C-methylase UbiE